MATTSFLGSTTAAVSLNGLKPSSAAGTSQQKGSLLVRASISPEESSRRNILKLAAGVLVGGIVSSVSGNANASLVDDLLAKSAANKDLNDKKRLATSGANLARAYTVTFGTCKFPENFTGCQDLAKKTDVKFLTEDLKVECEGKDKYKCGSNVFWKWGK